MNNLLLNYKSLNAFVSNVEYDFVSLAIIVSK